MGNMGSITIFIAASFVFAWAILVRKDSMSEKLRKPLALVAITLVSLAFILILVSLFQLS